MKFILRRNHHTYLLSRKDSAEPGVSMRIRTAFKETKTRPSVFASYPNPTANYLMVEQVLPGTKITIFNLTGQPQWEKIINSNAIEINISDFSPGIYFISDNKGHTGKFIKL